jgi:hypothetical protein
MNNKLQSYSTILAITCAVAVPLLIPTAHELPVQAALTPPASYDYSYQYSNWGESNTIFQYTQTPDGVYYNYTSTAELTYGLEVTHIFNRSNTNWEQVGSYWYPDDTKIGSNNSVGTVANKISLKFDNNTSKDYLLYVDVSSTSGSVLVFNTSINTYSWNGQNNFNVFSLNTFYISAGTSVLLNRPASGAQSYFDAWYLKDLGVSLAYDAGYDAGEDAGYIDGLENSHFLITAVESLIGMFLNFTFIIFTLEIFGVNILMIIGALFGIIAITWILKTIRG